MWEKAAVAYFRYILLQNFPGRKKENKGKPPRRKSFSETRTELAIYGISATVLCTRVGTLIVATIYLQLIQNRYMLRSFTVLQCSHQHCLQPVASDVEVVGYL